MPIYKSLVEKISISPDSKTKQKDYLTEGALPVIDQGRELIGGYTNNTQLQIQCTLPVVVFGDHTRAVKYIDFPFAAGADGIKVIEPKEGLNPKFLYYATQYLVLRLDDKGYARHYQHLEKKEIDIPSTPEQARIVSRIEELFSKLDNAEETLRATKQQLAVYRQAVLNEAFSFTEQVDFKKIFEFCDVGTGATPLTSCTKYYGGTIPWVTSTKINDSRIYEPTDYITGAAITETNCKVYPANTLLVTMYGEGKTRGKCAELMISAAVNQALAAIQICQKELVYQPYLKWYLELNYQNIRKQASGGVQPNLNLSIIKNIVVPLVEYEKQVQIVGEIESRLSVCDSLDKTVDTALAQAAALRQSILKRAFEGGL